MKFNFSQTNSILNEYITKDININSNKTKKFKDIITNYEKFLFSLMGKIQKIIDKKTKNSINIIIFILIFISIFIKFILEIYFLLGEIFCLKNLEIKISKLYFILITFFIIFFVFLFYICFDNNNLRNCDLNIAFFME